MTSPFAAPLPIARLVGVGSVVFFANAALLVLQLVAGRLLAPFVGSSLETWTTIIGVFLTGIALGNAYGGKLADRYPTPKTLAALLVLGAIAALWMMCFPMLLSSSGVYKSLPLVPRIPILTAILCLPAGFVLSLLTPLSIKLGLPDVGHTGRVAGLIFSLSTLGCLLGNYVTGFYLIPAFTINALVVVSAGMLIVLAAGTMLVLQADPPANESVSRESPTDAPQINPFAFADIRTAYLIVFLCSFGGMALELAASRMIAQYLGVSLYTWTGVIGVMLAGTALGNFSGGLMADHVNRPGNPLNPRVGLAGSLLLAGGATVFVLVMLAIITRAGLFGESGLITQVLGMTFALFFLPMYLLGTISPQVIRLAVPDVAHVGRIAGRVYAWSTAGAIVGTFATGYRLLSTFGVNLTILGIAAVVTLTSLLVVPLWKESSRGEPASPGAKTNSKLLYIFSIVLGGICGGFILNMRKDIDSDLLEIVETNYYTIRVVHTPDSDRPNLYSLNLDFLRHSTVDLDDPRYLYYRHEYIQVEFLRAAFEQTSDPRVLVIGGGGYTFPRYAMETMPRTRMDVVEIDPGVTQVAYRSLGLKKDYGLTDINMDGRQFVAERATPGSYDLVVQDAVNDFSVPSHLLTKEYNDEVKKCMTPNGVYLLTIIDSIEQGKLWKAAMRTLLKSNGGTFEHVTLFWVEPDDGRKWSPLHREVYVIYASDRPFDASQLRAAVGHQLYREFEVGGWMAASTVGIAPPGSGLPGLFAPANSRFLIDNVPIRTLEIPAPLLDPYRQDDPGVFLTDQYAPVDNLMADVFRKR